MNEERRREGRVPPYSAEAEEAVLGSVLLNNDVIAELRGILTPGDFYVETNRRIYEAILELAPKSVVDHVTLGQELKRRGDWDRIGGAAALDGLTDTVAAVANFEHYAGIVRDKAAVRRMIYAAQQIVADGFADHDDLGEYLGKSQQSINAAATAGLGALEGPELVGARILDVIEQAVQGKEPEGIVPTGFSHIDNTTGGLWPGEMTIFAARTKMGKTAFALNLGKNAARKAGKRVLWFNLEDSKANMQQRLIAQDTKVSMTSIRRRQVPPELAPIMVDAGASISELPFWVLNRAGLTADQIVSISTTFKAKHGLDLVIIDHLRRVKHLKGQDFRIGVSYVGTTIADMALNLGVPVLALHQLNRSVENREDKRPRESDLRESGMLEEDARNIWFLYRDAYYDENADTNIADLIVSRSNHGPTGVVKLFCDMPTMKFTDLADDNPYATRTRADTGTSY